jgi:phytoene desaturase
VYGLVSSYIEDPRLRQVFTFQPLLVGGNPFNTTSIYMLIHWLERKWGVHFAKGGTGALINALTRLLDELDVDVRLNTPVERIEVTNGRATAVETASGERIPCDVVVSNADPSMVYTKMIAPEHRRTNTDASIGRIKQSMSLFVMYFGAKGVWKDTAHHTILLGPRYKELLRDIFDRRVLADDFSLYLHAPGRSDPSLNPPGHDGFYVLSPVPNNKSGVNWEETAGRYGEKIIDALGSRRTS